MAFLKTLARSALVAALLITSPASAATVRLKELVEVQGVRENELFGYGLVVGLAGTGDTEQVVFTSQAIAGMLGRFGARIDRRDIRVRNVAAVMVTARLQTYARPGTHLDVSVASMGNARSLAGGVLLITPLTGADGVVYAVSQGPVQVGGYDASSSGSFSSKNQPTSGRVPGGGIVEKSVSPNLSAGPIILQLKRPDFTTASRIAKVIEDALGAGNAKAIDPAAVEVKAPEAKDAVALLAKIEALEVDADQRARVVVSERTGTVVAGDRVRIRAVAVAHGGLTVSVHETPFTSQPNSFTQNGQAVTTRTADITATEAQKQVVALPATASVDELVKALNLLGATPRDLVAILQAMKAAGALDADLEVL